jgi:hypothetical protein
MFLYFFSARSSLLEAGSGSSDGRTTDSPEAEAGADAVGGLGISPSLPAGSGPARTVSPGVIGGCPAGSSDSRGAFTDLEVSPAVAVLSDVPPWGVVQLPIRKPKTNPSATPMMLNRISSLLIL